MRKSFFLKVLVVIATVATTHFATTYVVSLVRAQGVLPNPSLEIFQVTGAMGAAKVQANPAAKSKLSVNQVTALTREVPATRQNGFIASGSLNSGKIEVEKGLARISVAGTLVDTEPDRNYLWSLWVRNPKTDEVIFFKHYDTQVFTVGEAGTLAPTFEEEIPLASGTYRIEAILTQLTPDLDWQRLGDRKFAAPYSAFGLSQKVTIP